MVAQPGGSHPGSSQPGGSHPGGSHPGGSGAVAGQPPGVGQGANTPQIRRKKPKQQ